MSGYKHSLSKALAQHEHFDTLVQATLTANAPPGSATLFSYTVGAGRVSTLECFHLFTNPSTAAGSVFVIAQVTRGGVTLELRRLLSNTITQDNYFSPCDIKLNAGDIVRVIYSNTDAVNRFVAGDIAAKETIL